MMEEMANAAMRPLRSAAGQVVRAGLLHPLLRELSEDVTAHGNGVYFAGMLRANPHLSVDTLGATGHEALVNAFHLDDFADKTDPSHLAAWCVGQGMLR